ncbi:MAG: PP2C family protein-serine/threonine phosphatase [Lachnospiraceae bacterium]|nr:PP2C family protein-serine/threonine phosphatase [Lachnospiraceae bacterium]
MGKLKMSLRKKTVIAITLISALLATVAIVLSYRIYCDTMDDHYKKLASNVAKTAASQMNGDVLGNYLVTMETDEEYDRMYDILMDIKENNDVEWLYIQKLDLEAMTGTYIIDADVAETACPLGETGPIAETAIPYLDTLEEGIPPFITDTEDFGWICTSCEPIFDSNGDVAAIACVDISMNEVMEDRHDFLMVMGIAITITALLAILALAALISVSIVNPINRLAKATGSFIQDKEKASTAISELNIHTGDEIENLSHSVKRMERDINEYIDNLTRITAEKERISAELNVATQIQASILPSIFPPFPDHEEFSIYAVMNPAKEVGGDFYDFFLTKQGKLAVVVADVSGKGVPAALFMVIAKTLIKNHAQSGESPAEVFENVNRQLCENNDAGMFVTSWLGILDLDTFEMTFANAGHNPPVRKKKGETFDYIKTRPDFILAGMDGVRYHNQQLSLAKGDILYIYSDGVTEATDIHEEMYGTERLKAVLEQSAEQPLDTMLKTVRDDIDTFGKGAPQFDDITMLGLRLK